MKSIKSIVLVIVGVLTLLGAWYYNAHVHADHHEFEEGVEVFNNSLEKSKTHLEQELVTISKKMVNLEKDSLNTIALNIDNNQHAFCVLKQGELVFWTNNKFPVDQLSRLTSGIHLLKNGWYFVNKKPIDKAHELVGLYQIKKAFKQENKYLKNSFNPNFALNKDWDLSLDSSDNKQTANIQKSTGVDVYLSLNNGFSHGAHKTLSLIEVVAVLFILFGVYYFSIKKSVFIGYIAVFLLIGFRLLLLFTAVGAHYKEIEIFQPELYAASDLVPSFGDLILHLLFLTVIVTLVNSISRISENKVVKGLFASVGISTAFIFGMLLSLMVESLIQNSIIPLDLSDVSVLNLYSLVSFLFLGSSVFGYYLFLNRLFKNLSMFTRFRQLVLIIASAIVCCLLVSITGVPIQISILSWLWVVPLCFLILFRLNKVSRTSFSLLHYFPEMLLFCVLFTVHMENIKSTKQAETIKQILEREAQERDPIAEFLIVKSSNRILNEIDTDELDSIKVNTLLSTDYFSKYLNKFNVSWSLDTILKDNNIEQVKKGDHSAFTKINDLLYRKMTHGSMSYLSKMPFENIELSVLFSAKEIPVDQGFPMLLASRSMEKMALDQGYSFAKYKDEKLVRNKGDYSYQTRTSFFSFQDDSETTDFFNVIDGDFEHTVLNKNGNTYVLTNQRMSYLSLIANLSYMLLLLSVFLFVGGVSFRMYKQNVLFPKDFKSRLQYAILFILFFSTLVIASGSVYFLKDQYNKENFEAISEKVKSVDLALNHKFIDGQKVRVQQLELNELAQTFFTDINIFDASGVLVQTSQISIFDASVLSKVQNPVAFKEIFHKNKAIFVQIERIEEMNYLSAYVPMYNENEELVGCLNLPYFAKTNELQSEINGFLVALINMYLLLTVISIIIALFISDRIVKPLQLIQNKIANFNLKDTPEQIEWETNDEIGSLVREYNRMVNELSESALRLAQAEREGAWKEMAQQVAHEIKNPLTPMKLNLQHFQMKWSGLNEQEKKDGFSELSRNLVEQIDTLSAIAEQFSNFARIPEPQLASVDLISILKSSTGIYNGSNEVEVKCNLKAESAFTTADKDQLLRIFNNVIKNAIQSIPPHIKGLVVVTVQNQSNTIVVTVRDNGMGISDDQKLLIFQPNFTTKTSGMGLGLAMVKRMLESVNATIYFDSEIGKGTTFYLSFKVS